MAKPKRNRPAVAGRITPTEDVPTDAQADTTPAGDPAFTDTEPGLEGGGSDDDQDDAQADDLAAELPPLGTPAETDPPVVDAQAVAALTSLEPQVVTGGPLDSPETPGTTDGTAAPGDSGGTVPETPKKGGRYDTEEKKAERNRKERERQARKRAQAAQAAGKSAQVAKATQVARNAQAAPQAPASVTQAAPSGPGVDLDVMLGLSFHAIALALPEKWGGGTLTAAERELLGKAWAAPLAPYLSGAAGPWAVASISTVQVFAIRAMSYTPPVADSRPAQGHVREPGATVEPKAVAADPVADGIAVTAPQRTTQQEPGVGGDE